MSEPMVLPMVATTTTIQKFHGRLVSGSIWVGSDDEEARERQDELRRQRDHGRLDGHRHHHAEVADRAVQPLRATG